MHTPANIKKHPIHPMLVPIPIGLWIFSLICDVVATNGGPAAEDWATVALYTLLGGIVGALVAAVPGFIDMLSLSSPLKRTALVHMAINLTVVALYAINGWMRLRGVGETAPIWMSAFSVALLTVSGWLGGKMVYVHGVAVDPAADAVTDETHRHAPS